MRFLNQFLKFAADQFFMNKVLTVTGLREWLDHSTKAKLGWIVDAVITVDSDVSKILGIGKNTAYDFIRSGAIKSVRVGRQIRVPKSAFLEFLS